MWVSFLKIHYLLVYLTNTYKGPMSEWGMGLDTENVEEKKMAKIFAFMTIQLKWRTWWDQGGSRDGKQQVHSGYILSTNIIHQF
jgi:hypothetical protein